MLGLIGEFHGIYGNMLGTWAAGYSFIGEITVAFRWWILRERVAYILCNFPNIRSMIFSQQSIFIQVYHLWGIHIL